MLVLIAVERLVRAVAACRCDEVSANCEGLKGGGLVRRSCFLMRNGAGVLRQHWGLYSFSHSLSLSHTLTVSQWFSLLGLSVFKMLTWHTSAESKLMREMTAGDAMSMTKRL